MAHRHEQRRCDPHRGRGTPVGHPAARRALCAAPWVLGVLSCFAVRDARADPLEVASAAPVPMAVPASLGAGVVEHRTLSLYGLPVRGAFERVWTNAAGVQRTVAQRRPSAPPQLLPHQARVGLAELPAILAAHPSTQSAPQPADPPQLVYRVVLGEPLLVWEVQMPLSVSGPEPTRVRLWVSAATGRVLDERDEVFSARARVFLENPAVTPTPAEVELDLVAFSSGVPLDGSRVAALNCVDLPPEDEALIYPWHNGDECYGVVGLLSDQDGNFFPTLPDIVHPEQSQVVDDDYAQLSMYYHSQRFFERLAGLGVDSFACEKSTMLANFHSLDPAGALDFTPLNNAYYTNECDIEDGPTMIFGQGSEVDYGYDGDVVYHELGHGIVAHLSPGGLVDPKFRADGALVDARGLNESLADYFSLMLTEDPLLAEYVGRFSSGGSAYIRDAENGRKCPDNMIGQEHNDGEPFTAALWAARKRVGGERLDPLVLQMVMRLPPDASLEDAAGIVLAVADQSVQAGSLTPEQRDVLFRSLQARGLLDCPRVMTDPARVQAGVSMHLRRRRGGVLPFFPGPMQLRYEVPADTDRAVLRFKMVAKGSTDPVQARVLVRRAAQPITYAYHLIALDEDVELPDEGGEPEDPDPIREVISTTGDWDEEIEPVQYANNEYEAVIHGVAEGEVIHVAIVNVSTTTAVVSGARVITPGPIPPEAEAEEETGGLESAPEGTDVVTADEVVSGGCTCGSGGSAGQGGSGSGWSWALWVPWAIRRRGGGRR